jgi:small ligand-binding sensory domain FIST
MARQSTEGRGLRSGKSPNNVANAVLSASSFAVQTPSPERVARELGDTLKRVKKPAGGLVFLSGRLAELLPDVARRLAEVTVGTPFLVVGGAGVLTERGEIEGEAGAAGIVWSGGRTEVFALQATSAEDAGEALGRTLADKSARTSPAAIVYMRPEGFDPQVLEPLREGRASGPIFGGGTVAVDPVAIDAQGQLSSGRAAGMLIRGLSPPVVRSSPACRLLMPLRRITETRGSMVTKIDAQPALDVLSEVGQGLEGQPLVFAVLAEEHGGDAVRPDLLLRAVHGVDPVRRGLLITDEAREGMRIAFAVRDAAAARADLESVTREVGRALGGAAPRFGVYVNCAGRGAALYGTSDVDTKILRSRFEGVPFAGLQSSFEIAPHAGRPALQLYTGVVALFSAPS